MKSRTMNHIVNFVFIAVVISTAIFSERMDNPKLFFISFPLIILVLISKWFILEKKHEEEEK